ncbi:hypothetical protein HDV00_007079 [Rhizophlyctis rosea]|nr:hypothetical protein HDV00_007079 [Rhizophlyctis rosea]
MLQNGTDWNKHHGVGATLLENWVEERAVADREKGRKAPQDDGYKESDERDAGSVGSKWKELMKRGHQDILTHASAQHDMSTTFRESYGAAQDLTQAPQPPTGIIKVPRTGAPNVGNGGGNASEGAMGKRKKWMEAELLRQAIVEVGGEPTGESAREWISTHQADYGHEDVYGHGKVLARFANPITFWSSQAVTGLGTTICSTTVDNLRNLSSASRDRTSQHNTHQPLSTSTANIPREHTCQGGSKHCWCGGNDYKGHVCGVDGPDWVHEGGQASCGTCGALRDGGQEMGKASRTTGIGRPHKRGPQHQYETDNIPTPFGRGDVIVDGDGKDVCGKGGCRCCVTSVVKGAGKQDGKLLAFQGAQGGGGQGSVYHASGAGVGFGRHAAFTTPIAEFKGGREKTG